MSEIEIVPSLLSADFSNLAEEMCKVEAAGCRKIHIDVMDGHFAPNITIGPVVIKAVRQRTKLFFQTHLMIEHPEDYIEVFKKAGSDCIIIHQQACSNLLDTVRKIKNMGVKAGIALEPKNSIDSIRNVIDKLDMILIMSVEPGFSGQVYLDDSEKKVKKLKGLLTDKKLDIPIGVEGAINNNTALRLSKAGLTQLIIGSAVFNGNLINKENF